MARVPVPRFATGWPERAAGATFAICYSIFVALYAAMVFTHTKWKNYLLLAAMGLLGVLYFPKNNAASGMFIFVAAFVPFITESLAISLITIGLACTTLVGEGLLLH